MTERELRELIAGGENEQVEMTRAFDKADKMGQAICAFANDLGNTGRAGVLLLGVDDGGSISGKRIDDRQFASLGGLKSDGNLLPPPSMSVEKFALPEGDVVAITVFPSNYPPIRYNGQIWVRVGPRKALANDDDVHVLTERRAKFGIRDEELPCERANLNDLDLDLYRGVYLPRAVNAQIVEDDDRPILEQLVALRFFSREKNCPTNLGVLLFAKHPERFVPSAYVQYVKFDGDDNSGDVLQENAFKGPLVKTVQELDVFVKSGPSSVRPVPVSAFREDMVSRYPAWALRELVLNAIIHRDYFLGNAPIKFYEYSSGRIEISNAGGLFGRVNAGNFPSMNDYRNPLLAEAMKVLGMVNKYNRGIAKVNRELADNGNAKAKFEFDKPTEFRVTVYASQSGHMAAESGHMGASLSPSAYDIDSQDRAVLDAIARHPGIKGEAIFLEVKTSLRSVRRTLDRLKIGQKIEYRGSRRTGGWFVKT